VVDDCTRECLALVVDTSLSGQRVARERDRIIVGRGKPLMIVSDNVLRSEEGRLARQQVSVREHAPKTAGRQGTQITRRIRQARREPQEAAADPQARLIHIWIRGDKSGSYPHSTQVAAER
jgi:transposase InsO family protein